MISVQCLRGVAQCHLMRHELLHSVHYSTKCLNEIDVLRGEFSVPQQQQQQASAQDDLDLKNLDVWSADMFAVRGTAQLGLDRSDDAMLDFRSGLELSQRHAAHKTVAQCAQALSKLLAVQHDAVGSTAMSDIAGRANQALDRAKHDQRAASNDALLERNARRSLLDNDRSTPISRSSSRSSSPAPGMATVHALEEPGSPSFRLRRPSIDVPKSMRAFSAAVNLQQQPHHHHHPQQSTTPDRPSSRRLSHTRSTSMPFVPVDEETLPATPMMLARTPVMNTRRSASPLAI